MNAYLSKTMPELSDTEIKCRGIYPASYYEPAVKAVVISQYMSVFGFLYKNGFKTDSETIKEVEKGLNETGMYQVVGGHGVVSIQR